MVYSREKNTKKRKHSISDTLTEINLNIDIETCLIEFVLTVNLIICNTYFEGRKQLNHSNIQYGSFMQRKPGDKRINLLKGLIYIKFKG